MKPGALQADLRTRIGTDGQRISRYENGKLTPATSASSASPKPSTSPSTTS